VCNKMSTNVMLVMYKIAANLWDHKLCIICVFSRVLSSFFVFHCTHVRMSYVLNSYLLTY